MEFDQYGDETHTTEQKWPYFLKKLTFESYKLYNFQEGEKKDKKLSYWHDIFLQQTLLIFSLE